MSFECIQNDGRTNVIYYGTINNFTISFRMGGIYYFLISVHLEDNRVLNVSHPNQVNPYIEYTCDETVITVKEFFDLGSTLGKKYTYVKSH